MTEVAGAVRSGDRTEALIALRDRLAEAIDEASPRDLPSLVLRLTDVLERIGNVDDEGSVVDEVARRRDERRLAAHASAGPPEDRGGSGRPPF